MNAQEVWGAIVRAKDYGRCAVLYTVNGRHAMYVVSVNGRMLAAWPRVADRRLGENARFAVQSAVEKGARIPNLRALEDGGFAVDAAPTWIDDFDLVPLFALWNQGRGLFIRVESIRLDVSAYDGRMRPIALELPDDRAVPDDPRLVEVGTLAWKMFGPVSE